MLQYFLLILFFVKCVDTMPAEGCHLQQVEDVVAMATNFADTLKWKRMVLLSDQMKDSRLVLKTMGSVQLMFQNVGLNFEDATTELNRYDHLALWCGNVSYCQNIVSQQLEDKIQLYIGKQPPVIRGYAVFWARHIESNISNENSSCNDNEFILSFSAEGNFPGTNGSQTIGHWSKPNGIAVKNSRKWISKEVYMKNLIVMVREQAPYVYYVANEKNEMVLSGFVIEMLRDFAEDLNFNYTIKMSGDRRTGYEDGNSSWTGLMGALQRNEVDMVASDVSISSSRLRVADFSAPFLRSSSAIVVQRVLYANFGQSYTKAFAVAIWCLIGLVVLTTAVCITVSWAVEMSAKLTGTMGICNHAYTYSCWEAIYLLTVNLMEQGNDFYAERFSTRIMLVVFLAFSMVIFAYYNSVLTAQLAIANPSLPFDTVETLVTNAPQYDIGIVNGGSYYSFLQNSVEPALQLAWKKVLAEPHNFFNSTEEAIRRVATEELAFVDSSLTIKYEIRDSSCGFMLVRQRGGIQGYHLTFPKGSPYVEAFSQEIRGWQSGGLFQRLEKKYFTSRSICTAKEDIVILGLEHMLRIFIVVLVGYMLAMVALFGEKIFNRATEEIKKSQIVVNTKNGVHKFQFTVQHKPKYYKY